MGSWDDVQAAYFDLIQIAHSVGIKTDGWFMAAGKIIQDIDGDSRTIAELSRDFKTAHDRLVLFADVLTLIPDGAGIAEKNAYLELARAIVSS